MSILQGILYDKSWCPHCNKGKIGDNVKLTIEEMKEIAKLKKGECLSKKYTNNQTNLLWRCENGHKWEASYAYIKSGYWCSKCKK